MKLRLIGMTIGICAALTFAVYPTARAKDAPPEKTPEGLVLTKNAKNRIVYLKPGATFAQYNRVAILDCPVEFEKDWQKDYNSSRRGLDGRVSDKDVARIKSDLAAEFKKVFTTELQDRGGYQVVDKAGADVLVLRPALLNVEVNAPDIMSPGINATVVRSAGQMTLFLELWDSTTNTLLARIMDAQADNDTFGKTANRATNKQAADEILRDWAHELRVRLDEIKGKTTG